MVVDDIDADPFARKPKPVEDAPEEPTTDEPASTRTPLRARHRLGAVIAGWGRSPFDRRRSLQWSAVVVGARNQAQKSPLLGDFFAWF